MGNDVVDDIEMGRFLKYTNFPVYKIPAKFPIGHLRSREHISDTLLFDTLTDYEQKRPLKDPLIEAEMEQKLVKMMHWADAPDEQFERVGLRK